MRTYSEKDSEIIHIIVDNKVRHIIERTILTDNPTEPYESDENTLWILSIKSSKKVNSNEFNGYLAGRVYTYIYFKFLD